jgi:hypothetical protein
MRGPSGNDEARATTAVATYQPVSIVDQDGAVCLANTPEACFGPTVT